MPWLGAPLCPCAGAGSGAVCKRLWFCFFNLRQLRRQLTGSVPCALRSPWPGGMLAGFGASPGQTRPISGAPGVLSGSSEPVPSATRWRNFSKNKNYQQVCLWSVTPRCRPEENASGISQPLLPWALTEPQRAAGSSGPAVPWWSRVPLWCCSSIWRAWLGFTGQSSRPVVQAHGQARRVRCGRCHVRVWQSANSAGQHWVCGEGCWGEVCWQLLVG